MRDRKILYVMEILKQTDDEHMIQIQYFLGLGKIEQSNWKKICCLIERML